MKSDLDRLMSERGLDALVITGGEGFNPARHYLSGGAHITGGLIVKKRGDAPLLIVNGMEIEEAKKSGLTVYTTTELGWMELIKAAEGSTTKANVAFWGRCLEKAGVPSGKIGVYGTGDINVYIELIRLLEKAYPQYQFVGETGLTLLDAANLTKDPDEFEKMRDIGRRTCDVLQATWDFIASHKADGDRVVNGDGEALTIGAVKGFVRRALLDRGLEDTGMIFAQGRDGGFPHSRGDAETPLQVGQPIVFDLFPREVGGGYFHDVTRTWCINRAPDEVREVYNTVMESFDIAVESFGVGKPTHLMQDAVLDYFERKGHPTQRSNPSTGVGYVHSLGHGVGIEIHERPSLSHILKEDSFQVGNIFTVEPGLYYPEKGYGVRVEDTFAVTPDGQLVSLTPFRKDLILPLKR